MKNIMRLMLVFMLVFAVVPAFGAEVMQMWRCQVDDDATEEDVDAMAHEWLDAAKKIPGGENFKAFVNYPVVVNAPGEIDILFVVIAPSMAEWGKFWDSYVNSPSEGMDRVDKKYKEKIACPSSALWEVRRVK
ncbi:conserved hypothetical protein [delta proteobacterium NaphS2]|nr:conserved hypothetical protein [delta proteobacterium NaphS2]